MDSAISAGFAGMAGVAFAKLLRGAWAARTARRLQARGAINGTVVGSQLIQVSEARVKVGYVVDYVDLAGQPHRLFGAVSRRPLQPAERVEVRYPPSNPSLGWVYPLPLLMTRLELVLSVAFLVVGIALSMALR